MQKSVCGEKYKRLYILMLYKTILGRNPDYSGLEKWCNVMEAGHSLQYLFNGFLFSNEFKDQCSKAGINVGSKIATPEDSGKIITQKIYRTHSNNKYHFSDTCGGDDLFEISYSEAMLVGLDPCEKCAKH